MKVQVCSKCNSSDIIYVPGDVGAYGVGNNVAIGFSIFNYVKVDRYLCGNCGYVEHWIERKEDIEKVRKKYGFYTQKI